MKEKQIWWLIEEANISYDKTIDKYAYSYRKSDECEKYRKNEKYGKEIIIVFQSKYFEKKYMDLVIDNIFLDLENKKNIDKYFK